MYIYYICRYFVQQRKYKCRSSFTFPVGKLVLTVIKHIVLTPSQRCVFSRFSHPANDFQLPGVRLLGGLRFGLALPLPFLAPGFVAGSADRALGLIQG